eukprot:Rhum_TRINITY_DN24970_c0_g1::Rhum_TRINITY_DN24970_c0_g1_i1::g.180719::m.180719
MILERKGMLGLLLLLLFSGSFFSVGLSFCGRAERNIVSSHRSVVVRATAALRRRPLDVAALDVARLAVQAVLRGNRQVHLASRRLGVVVHARGAEARKRSAVHVLVDLLGKLPHLRLQVRRLVSLVGGLGPGVVEQQVEGELAVRLRVLDLLALLDREVRLVVLVLVLHVEGLVAARHPLREAGVRDASPEVLGEDLANVPHLVQLLVQPRVLELALVRLHLLAVLTLLATLEDVLVRGLRGKHAALHRRVRSLDLRKVQEASRVADQHATGEGELRQGQKTALGERARAVRDARTSLKELGHLRVRLPLLHLHVRPDVRVRVVEAHNHAQRHLVPAHVVHPRAAVRVHVSLRLRDRPADRVPDQTLLVLRLGDLPHLLDAQAVRLRLDALAQPELLKELARDAAPAPLGEDGLLRTQDHARLEDVLALPLLADALVLGLHAHNLAVLDDRLLRREAREDVDAGLLSLLAHPRAHRTEADDVVPLVVQATGHQRLRHRHALVLRQDDELVVRHLRVQRGALLLPVRDQLCQRARLDARARQDVRADHRALLHDAHAQLAALVRLGQLLQLDGGGEAAGAAADNDNVVLHLVALDLLAAPPAGTEHEARRRTRRGGGQPHARPHHTSHGVHRV